MVKTGDWLSEAWQIVSGNLVTHIILALIVGLGSSITGGLLSGPLICGYLWIILREMKEPSYTPEIGDVGKGFENFVNTFLVGIVGGLIAAVGGILCGVGVILTAPLVIFAFPLVAEGKLGFWPAITDSINTVKKNYGAWIVFTLVLALINAVGGLVVVGWLITYPITIVAIALAYRETYGIATDAGPAADEPVVPPTPEAPESPSTPQ